MTLQQVERLARQLPRDEQLSLAAHLLSESSAGQPRPVVSLRGLLRGTLHDGTDLQANIRAIRDQWKAQPDMPETTRRAGGIFPRSGP